MCPNCAERQDAFDYQLLTSTRGAQSGHGETVPLSMAIHPSQVPFAVPHRILMSLLDIDDQIRESYRQAPLAAVTALESFVLVLGSTLDANGACCQAITSLEQWLLMTAGRPQMWEDISWWPGIS